MSTVIAVKNLVLLCGNNKRIAYTVRSCNSAGSDNCE